MYQKTVSFGEAIRMGFQRLLQFSGRSSRSEFWWWSLFIGIIAWILMGITISIEGKDFLLNPYSSPMYWVIMILEVITCLPIAVRRLHDIGKGGGWIFISLVPVIGGIWLLVLDCTASEPTPNRFGEVPNVQEQNWQ